MQPFFLPGTQGALFALYHPPPPGVIHRGSVLYIHPWAEELNKSRRMVALQARQLAAAGYAVLVPDLYGCGDSDGDFADARWAIWLADLRCCLAWLQQQAALPLHVWALRTGALLAMELIHTLPAAQLVLWQPVISGELALVQFLRLRTAAGLMKGERETVAQLQAQLAAGTALEVAGYTVAAELANALAAQRLQAPPLGWHVAWLERLAAADAVPARSSVQHVEAWQADGHRVELQSIVGEAFWMTQEITVVPAWLSATTACLVAAS